MTKAKKISNEKLYIQTLEQWLLYRGYYYHPLDCQEAYNFMYRTFKLSWHKTQKIIFKKISKEILDSLIY